MPTARPADILRIVAVAIREIAVDIPVTAPEAHYAGRDCVESAYRRKFVRYREIIREWGGSDREFRPMVWSSEGRAHPCTLRMMAYCCKRIALRRDGLSAASLMNRWQLEIGPILATRRTRMARAILEGGLATSDQVECEQGHGVVAWPDEALDYEVEE